MKAWEIVRGVGDI